MTTNREPLVPLKIVIEPWAQEPSIDIYRILAQTYAAERSELIKRGMRLRKERLAQEANPS